MLFFSNRNVLNYIAKLELFSAVFALTACGLTDSTLVQEARSAETDGRTVSNEAMKQMYPRTYRAGNPKYLERDFEAGADFICDEIRIKYQQDMCGPDGINWK